MICFNFVVSVITGNDHSTWSVLEFFLGSSSFLNKQKYDMFWCQKNNKFYQQTFLENTILDSTKSIVSILLQKDRSGYNVIVCYWAQHL